MIALRKPRSRRPRYATVETASIQTPYATVPRFLMTIGVKKNGTIMPTTMAIQFIVTLRANRFEVAIS